MWFFVDLPPTRVAHLQRRCSPQSWEFSAFCAGPVCSYPKMVVFLSDSLQKPQMGTLKETHAHIYIIYNAHTLHYITTLLCIALHCITLHYITLRCIALHGTARHGMALHCIALQYCTVLYCTVLYITYRHDPGQRFARAPPGIPLPRMGLPPNPRHAKPTYTHLIQPYTNPQSTA